MASRVWFLTGCSTGFGRSLSRVLIDAGDRVVVTARDVTQLASLTSGAEDRVLALPLDVTDGAAIARAVAAALARFGRIDVLVNNAGYGILGALEETPAADIRRIFDTNVLGLIEVTRAVLPAMRAQRSGHILNLSSVAGFSASAGFGIYNATKFAVEGLSEALAVEVASFGIKVIIVEPGPFRTDFINRSLGRPPAHPAYAEAMAPMRRYLESMEGKQPGDPERAARAMRAIVDEKTPPLRLPLGRVTVERMRNKLRQVAGEIDRWEQVANDADFPEGSR